MLRFRRLFRLAELHALFLLGALLFKPSLLLLALLAFAPLVLSLAAVGFGGAADTFRALPGFLVPGNWLRFLRGWHARMRRAVHGAVEFGL